MKGITNEERKGKIRLVEFLCAQLCDFKFY